MSTPEEKAALRKAERERRQARVKGGGTDRLAKITGVAGSRDFKPPVPSEPRSVANVPAQRAAPASDPLLDFLRANGGDQDTDPLMAMLAASNAQNTFPDNQQAQQAQTQQNIASAQQRSRHRAKTDFVWDTVHFLVSIALGAYAALGNPWNICTAFTTVQFVIVATQVVLGHRSSGLDGVAMLAPFIGMLPKNRQRQLNVAGGIIGAARAAYKDLAIIVFVYGVLSAGGQNFVRPQ